MLTNSSAPNYIDLNDSTVVLDFEITRIGWTRDGKVPDNTDATT